MNTKIWTSVPFECPIAGFRTDSKYTQKLQLIQHVTPQLLTCTGWESIFCPVLFSSDFLAQVIHILTLRPRAATWVTEVEDFFLNYFFFLEWKFSCLLHGIKRLERTSTSRQFTFSSPFPCESSTMAMSLLINIYPASAWRPPAVETLRPSQKTLILTIRRFYLLFSLNLPCWSLRRYFILERRKGYSLPLHSNLYKSLMLSRRSGRHSKGWSKGWSPEAVSAHFGSSPHWR